MAIATEIVPATDPRELALLKAIGLDRVAPEQRELALKIADKYQLDPFLKHIVLIDGKPFVTRDALLFIAHRSGQFDGIEVTTPEIVGDEWRCTATVWRKDFSHPFVYGGRYPTKGGNQKFAPEMAIKVAESMALRRAFNVAAPVVEERWDLDVPVPEPMPKPTLAERAAEKAAEIQKPAEPVEEPAPAGPLLVTKPQFVAALDEYGITSAYAKAVREVMYPDLSKDLNDAERGELLTQLTKDMDTTAEPVPA